MPAGDTRQLKFHIPFTPPLHSVAEHVAGPSQQKAQIMDFAIRSFRQCLHSARGNRLALLAGGALIMLAAALYLGMAPRPLELGRHHPLDVVSLKQHWAQGDMIVLVRHLERCDHAQQPCLNGNSGITRRAVEVTTTLGQQFQRLGLANSDVFNSPLERTAQSATLIFGAASSTQDWLASCKKTMDKDVFAHKQPRRNLILVTHSECIAQLEQAMHFKPITLDYGASLFLVDNPATGTPQMLGYIDSDDWQEVMPP